MPCTLNDDLWRCIFQTATFTESSISLFVICSVSSYWRGLASSTPLLWTWIEVDREIQLMSTAYIQRFIINSGTAPLEIVINLPGSESNNEKVLTTLETFRICAERVKSLWISAKHYGVVARFFGAMGKGKPAPLLASLQISVQIEYPVIPFDWLSTSYSPAPNLRTLVIPTPELPNGSVADTLLSAVTDLYVTLAACIVDIVPILEFIGRGKVLERFHYHNQDIFTYDVTNDFDCDILVPTSLRSIDVTGPGGGTDILRCLNAPALEHIRLDSWREFYRLVNVYWEDEAYQLKRYMSVVLERTSARSTNLRSLHLEYIHLEKPDEEYRYILSGEWFPHLEELLMKVLKITDVPFIAAAPIATPLKKFTSL